MIYFLCPYHRTGGPENMHFTCSMLNQLAGTTVATIAYMPPHPNEPMLYPEIGHVHITPIHKVDDIPTNIIVIPEIYCVRRMRREFCIRHCQYVVWWQSYVHACINYTLGNWDLKDVWHAFHSYYQYVMVRPHLSLDRTWFFLTDFIADEYTSFDASSILPQKQDVVCFNGHKDKITRHVCDTHRIPYIEIKKMSRAQVMETMRQCKVYVDMGSHPGKDHMPREAVMMGCVVITNKSGSAAYFEDVGIHEKVRYEDELPNMVERAFQQYDEVYRNQETYRQTIRQEKEQALFTARNFYDRTQHHVAKYADITCTTYRELNEFKTKIWSSIARNIVPSLDDDDETVHALNITTLGRLANANARTIHFVEKKGTTTTLAERMVRDMLLILAFCPEVRVIHVQTSPSSSSPGTPISRSDTYTARIQYMQEVYKNRFTTHEFLGSMGICTLGSMGTTASSSSSPPVSVFMTNDGTLLDKNLYANRTGKVYVAYYFTSLQEQRELNTNVANEWMSLPLRQTWTPESTVALYMHTIIPST